MYRVFLVDDEPFILEGLYDAIDWASYGLELTGKALNGRKALELLREVPVDLLITDISMPVMNGLELISAARQIHPDLKVIILSGFNEFAYLKEGMRLGIENYLLKPLNFAELKATLSNTVEKLNATRLRSMFESESIAILKDNILYRWLTATIDFTNLSERAQLLDIAFTGKYICTVLLRGSELDATFVKQLRELADTAEDRLFLRNMEGDAVFVLMDEQEERCRAKALACAKWLRDQPATAHTRISMGSVQPRGGGEARSYEHAQLAQEYFLLLHREEIALYDEFAAKRADRLPETELDYSHYRKWISTMDIEALVAQITSDFRQVQEAGTATPDRLRMLAVETLVWLHQEIGTGRNMRHILLDRMSASFNQAAKASEWEELLAIITEAVREMAEIWTKEDTNPTVKQVLLNVEEHYASDLSLKLLAQKYNIHPVYLGKLFQKETGESFTEYVNKFRIEQAKLLLRTTTLKIHEISKQVGYWDSGYFYKQFKKYVGITPADYKTLHYAGNDGLHAKD
jgi:two-component system response regulator YesN